MDNSELFYRQGEQRMERIQSGADYKNVENAQAAYRECVEACVQIFKKRGFTYLPKKDISRLGFAMDIADTLTEAVKIELDNLNDEDVYLSVEGDDHEKFFAGQYAILKGLTK